MLSWPKLKAWRYFTSPARPSLVDRIGVMVASERVVDHPIIRNLGEGAEVVAVAGARNEQSAHPLGRRVGVREIRQPQDRHAVDLHRRVFILDQVVLDVLRRGARADLPQRIAVRVLRADVAGRIDGAAEFVELAFGAAPAIGGELGVLRQRHVHHTHDAVRHVVAEFGVVGIDDLAVRARRARHGRRHRRHWYCGRRARGRRRAHGPACQASTWPDSVTILVFWL